MGVALPIIIGLGVTLFVFVIVFAAVGKAIDRAAEALEGIEKDSGRTVVTVRMKKFRAPGLIAGGLRRVPARFVLTSKQLHIIMRPQRYGIIERAELGRFTVANLGGQLHLHTEDPPGATGSVDYRATVPDPDAWVAALTAAGARAA
jgi:hypothetical protein